ncbi:uncharacterized protein V1513DRAFT_428504 [Lipomyces chichibuensis]|uniref:uncharacterized protein n=1 Tax=Lipomyces chichibuensis TaxID=1546026 RepID=UPI003343DAC1
MSSYPDAANEMGAYVFQYKRIIAAQEEFSWEEVVRFGKALRKGTTKSSGYILGMLKYLFGNISGWMEAKVGKVREADMELSNVGAWKFTRDFDDETSFRVLNLGFSQPHGTLNPPVKLNTNCQRKIDFIERIDACLFLNNQAISVLLDPDNWGKNAEKSRIISRDRKFTIYFGDLKDPWLFRCNME